MIIFLVILGIIIVFLMALLVVQNIKIKNDYHEFLNQHVGEIESIIYMLRRDK